MKFFFKRSKSSVKTDPGKTHEISGEYRPELVENRVPQQTCDSLEAALLRKKMGESGAWYSNQRSPARGDLADNRFVSQSITVDIGRLLQRVPRDLLIDGAQEMNRPVEFRAGDLIALIVKKKPFMNLSIIVKACPELFREEITVGTDLEIMFPWHDADAQIEACWGQA